VSRGSYPDAGKADRDEAMRVRMELEHMLRCFSAGFPNDRESVALALMETGLFSVPDIESLVGDVVKIRSNA
jgi:hypothetical protein